MKSPSSGPSHGDSQSFAPRILPMVAAGAGAGRSPAGRQEQAPGRMPEVVRTTVERLRTRLEEVAVRLRKADATCLNDGQGGAEFRRLAGTVEAVSQTLRHLGDLVAPDEAAARWISPRGVLESLLAETNHARHDRQLPPANIQLDVPEGHLIHADPTLVRRVFETLLCNALDAADQGGDGRSSSRALTEVVVTSVAYADFIEIEVADSGAGLSPHARAWLFEPGFTTKPDGAGLGLAAARALVSQLGGTLDVLNCPEGGAAFTLKLPCSQPRRMAA